jgi:hypothetical protein
VSDAAQRTHSDPSSELAFYRELPSFADFSTLPQAAFTPVPAEWVVFITDVIGSTAAIEAGRYKDVNTIGAASVSTVLHELGSDFPYVFGGDGATLVVPAVLRQRVERVLLRLASLAQHRFDLGLRVGAVSIAELQKDGCTVEVARHELAAGRCVALFRGGGLQRAEQLIKGDAERYACRDGDQGASELTGLSCRWNRIPASRGVALSLLVEARGDGAASTYGRVLDALAQQFGGGVDQANPVQLAMMQYRSRASCARDERRYHSRFSFSYAWRMFEICVAVVLFGWGVANLLPGMRRYRRAMRLHADHRKFDDMLRMVVDCSPEQADAIERFLTTEHEAGAVCFGLHRATACLMTCYVEALGPGQHIHFIDGDDGGYALAAKQLKAQLRACAK